MTGKASSTGAQAQHEDCPEPRADQKVKKLSALFSLLGSDPEKNVRIIVEQSCQVLESASSAYCHLHNGEASVVCASISDAPADLFAQSIASGAISRLAVDGNSQAVMIGDLEQPEYADIDPAIKQFGFKSFLGHIVQCKGKIIGTLFLMDTRTRHFSEVDDHILGTLAKALSLEEERKQAEADLRNSETKHRRLYKMVRLMADNVPDLIWAKDLDDHYMFVNQALCDKLLKCDRPEEAIGKTDGHFADMEKQQGHRHTFGAAGIQSDEITKVRRTSGRFVEEGLVRNENLILDVHKAPFWDEDGNLIGTVGCGRDITSEKKTAKALLESEKRYEDLYNNTPVMLYSMDHEDLLTSVSNLWLETMGYTREEVLGRSALDFFTKESRQAAVENILPQFYKSGQMKSRPFEFVTKSGEPKDVMLSAIAQRDDQGNYNGALAFMVDMTQAKAAEKDQRRLTARLQQAQKMEAIATLAGGIAHQFNNALAVILGNIELIQMDGLADLKLTRFIEPINQAGQKMVQLTSQLLAYARGGKFQTQVVPSHHFVREALSLVNHSLASFVELKTDLDVSTDPIEVDSTQMQMLLAAILSNASEAIEKKGCVTVDLKNVELAPDDCIQYQGLKPGRHVLLRISDTGKGMDDATRQRVFEPFFTTKFQGRGLGMAAVYGIVKKHCGFVYVESEEGQGTTVSIYLPCAAAPKKDVAKKTVYAAQGSGTALIVEDEHLVMEVNRAIVEKLGYRVLEAKSGKDALKIARTFNGTIDFVLLDVILPDMSGNQIYPKLKELIPDLKVIVCSGFTLDGPAREILDAGAESFLPKPFTVAALSTALDEILNPPMP